ncbi:4143_t:CDS:2 [Paraglomus brasilianum]|uniref:Alpha-1,3-glucosyltransferase n=1 Tax=Paraglomus brasilianum TaxID=144538 RepID=A0A9N9C2A0_9GLOM|nr:4143_t:CDS:2 [Paraglomus brasilianum]
MPKIRSTKTTTPSSSLSFYYHDSPAWQILAWSEDVGILKWMLYIIVLFSLFIRCCVALWGYSGYNTPPKYGDYEAQRHWMELTLHVPIDQWYYYDLDWWGLDYPPLTAYVSWICGKIGSAIEPKWFTLDESRGHESPDNKVFMRMTVLISEYIIYVPAVYVFVKWYYRKSTQKEQLLYFFLIVMQPSLILIDHGHFQYNSIMLGLTIWAINCYSYGYYVIGSIFFCLALCFKQMALYYALPVFFYLLGICARDKKVGLNLFLKLGITVIVTLGILFFPFLSSISDLQQAMIRIFPLYRGLWEDKVANFWCALNIVVKLREIFQIHVLAKISLLATLLFSSFPSYITFCLSYYSHQPSLSLYTLSAVSMAFFLFSFQVHEKSILLPLMPITLLIGDGEWEKSKMVMWINSVGLFSLYPLLKKDELAIPYFVLFILYNWFFSSSLSSTLFLQSTAFTTLFSSKLSAIAAVLPLSTYMPIILFHMLELFLPPPQRYPDVYVVGNVVFCAGWFGVIYLGLVKWHLERLRQLERERVTDTKKVD